MTGGCLISSDQKLGNPPSVPSWTGAPPRVLVVSSVRIVREGLIAALLRGAANWAVTTGATLDAALSSQSETPSPNVVLIDMGMLGAHDAAEKIGRISRLSRVVAFAAGDSDAMFLTCVEWGIVGFVSRESSLDDLILAVESALRGEAILSARLTVALMQRIAADRAAQASTAPHSHLTRRERQILALIDDGLSNKEIAGRLVIELATVKNHVHSILEKTHCRRRGEAAAIVRRSLR